MRKTYITPCLKSIKVEARQMLAMSIKEGQENNQQWSNKYQGGILWEDDSDEE